MPATDKPAEPWDRQPSESPESWAAFVCYLGQGGGRSVRRVAQECGKDPSLIARWSSANSWVRRVAAHQRHIDELRRRERDDALIEMSRRQGAQLADAAAALSQPVQAFLSRIRELNDADEDPYAGMSIETLHRMTVQAIRHLPGLVEAERLVAGLSTDNLSSDAPVTVEEARRRAEAMTRSELEDYLLGVDDGRREFLRGSADDAPPA